MSTVGENIDRFRKKRGLTCKQLARRTGISPDALSYIINNRRKPNFNSLRKIAIVLGVSMFDLDSSSLLENLPRQDSGSIIEWYRLKKKITVDELSRATGINKDAVTNIILGRKKPRLANLKKFANLFGITVFDLLPKAEAGIESIQSIGTRIKMKRIAIGKSQEALEDDAGISRNRLCHIENDKQRPSYQVLKKLAVALKCRPFDLNPESLLEDLSEQGIGIKIESKRLENEMLLEELAEASGVMECTLRNVIRGKVKKPHNETLNNLARVFGCTIEELLS